MPPIRRPSTEPHRIAVCAALTFFLAAAAPALAGAPNHDDCGQAYDIPGLPFDHTEPDIESAAWDPSDPYPSCAHNEHTVWYRYTPSQTHWVLVTTAGSDFDSFLWAGTGSCGNLTEIACDDDSAGNFNAEIVFEAQAGTTYYIQAGSLSWLTDATLRIHAEETSAPPDPGDPQPATGNDDCAAPAEITTVPMILYTPLDGTTSDPDDVPPPCYSSATRNTVWYRYTSSGGDRQVRIDTSDSTFHSVITVFTGTCASLLPVDCDHNYGINGTYNHGMVDFLAEQGVTYLIMVSSPFQAPAGSQFRLDVSDGISHPIDVRVLDAATLQDLDAHVWIRDTTGGNYTLRDGQTGPDGRIRLYPPNPGNYEAHTSAILHIVNAEPAGNAGGPVQVESRLEPMGAMPQPEEEPTRIAFTTSGLNTMLPDASDERKIVSGDCFYYPSWSPDGSRIAFGATDTLTCTTLAPWVLWIVNADGTGLTRLVPNVQAKPLHIQWSPDGQWITYDYFSPYEGYSSIWKVNAVTGAGPVRLYSQGSEATWAPDSSQLAIASPGGTRIIRADGSSAMLVSTVQGEPDWSPDGRQIAVGDEGTIYVFNTDGTGLRVVASDPWMDFYSPEWSPDGQSFIISGTDLGTAYFHRINADGTGLRRIRMDAVQSNSAHDWALKPTYDVPGDFAPRVRLLDPDGGERMTPGTTHTIRWEATDDVGIASQDLHLIRNGALTPIALGLPGGARSHDWLVPDLPSHANARIEIRVRDTVGQDAVDRTKYRFSIADETNDPWVRTEVIHPAGGESFQAGQLVTIRWEYDTYWTPSDVALELSLDGGNSFDYIEPFVPAGVFSYSWTVPADVTSEAVIRVKQNSVYSSPAESGFFSLNMGAASNLNLQGAQPTDLAWQPSEKAGELETYDVVRGDVSALRSMAGRPGWTDLGEVVCLENDTPNTFATDASAPAAGRAFFYLVRPSTEGTWGAGSDGKQRRPGSGGCP